MRDVLLLAIVAGCFILARTVPDLVQRRAATLQGEAGAPIGTGVTEGADV
jgi:hypothetical protein